MNKHTLGIAVIGTLASSLILGQVAQAEEVSSTEVHDTVVNTATQAGESASDSVAPVEVTPETNESELASETVSTSPSESTDVNETNVESFANENNYPESMSEDKLYKIQGYKEFEETYAKGKALFRQAKWTFKSSAVLHQVLKDTHRDSNPLTSEQFQVATQRINETIAQLVPLKERQELTESYRDIYETISSTPYTWELLNKYPISEKFQFTRIDAPIVSAPTPEEWQTNRDNLAKLTQLMNREGRLAFIETVQKVPKEDSWSNSYIRWTEDSIKLLHQTIESLQDNGEDDFYINATNQIQQALDSLVEFPEGIELLETIDVANSKVANGAWTRDSRNRVTDLIYPRLENLRKKSISELRQLRSEIEVAMNNLEPHPFIQNIKSFTPNITNIIEGEHKEIEITLHLNDGITWDSIKDKISFISVNADVKYMDRKLTTPEQEYTNHFLFRYSHYAHEMLHENQLSVKIPFYVYDLAGIKALHFNLKIELKSDSLNYAKNTLTIRTPQINVSSRTPFDGIHNYITNTEIDKSEVTAGDSLLHKTTIAFPTVSLVGSYNIYRVGEDTPFKKVGFSIYDGKYRSPREIWYDSTKGGPENSHHLFTTIDIDDSFPDGEYEVRDININHRERSYETALLYTVPQSLYQRFTVKKKVTDTDNTTNTPRQFADATTNVAVVLSDKAPKSIMKMQVVDVDEAELAKQSEWLKSVDADLFAITFVDKDGNKVVVNESAAVTMPIDAGKQVARLIHFVPETNTATDLDFKQDGNQVTFTAPHFSIYGVIYAQVAPPAEKPAGNTHTNAPNTTPVEPNKSANTTAQASTKTEGMAQADTSAKPNPNAKGDNDTSNQQTLPDTGEGNSYAVFGAAALAILAGIGLVAPTVRKDEQA